MSCSTDCYEDRVVKAGWLLIPAMLLDKSRPEMEDWQRAIRRG